MTSLLMLAVDLASPWASALSWLLTPTGLLTALGILSGGAGLFFGATAVIWKRRLALLIFHGFHIVEDADAEMGNTKLDKTKAFLEAIDTFCKANGWRSLKPGEIEIAKLQAKAMNGEAEAKEAIQTKALIAAAPANAAQAAALIAGLK